MLTYRRALLAAAAVLALIYFFHASSSEPRHITADQLPKPASLTKILEQKHETTAAPAKPKKIKSAIKKPQISLQDLKEKPLRAQLEYQFPYDPQGKFPAYIWQTWKYTPSSGNFGEEFREAEASWTILHPSFVHEVITDDVAVQLLKHLYASVPDVIEAYESLPIPVLKADFFRYLILLARGGIYSDIDTAAIRPATDWVPENVPRSSFGMVIGIEADPDREDWADWYSRRIQFCQWTIQSKPGHPILVDIVANITETTLERKAHGTLKVDHTNIVDFTGPAVWTDLIFKFFNNPDYFDINSGKGNITWQQFTGIKAAKKLGDVIVLPITSFSPGIGQMNAGEDDDEMAFVKHNFYGSWKPEELRHIGEQEDAGAK